ncbi:MAG TPA: hypothetical protein VHS06_11155 [Chloroflexota bacterium]|nr:hypothetical protein [Chloroflexota bacterium]
MRDPSVASALKARPAWSLAPLLLLLLLPLLSGCGGGNQSAPQADLKGGGFIGKLVFTSNVPGTSNYNLYTLTLPLPGTRKPIVSGPAQELSPVWSPDGTRAAFVSNRSGHMQIYVVNADGSHLTRLTTNTYEDNNPCWSPDGLKIAFNRTKGPSTFICTINRDGTGSKALTATTGLAAEPAWSPNGARIAYLNGATGYCDIYSMSAVDGSKQVRLTTADSYDSSPAWSRDGARIVFVTDRGDTGDNASLWLMNADGTNQRRLTSGYHDQKPSYSPDGAYIIFARFITGGRKIMGIRPDRTGLVAFTPGVGVDDGDPSWVE